jgi:hypothetical protein
MTTTTEKLDRLAEMQAQQDIIKAHFKELRNSTIPYYVREKLSEIDAEEQTALEAAQTGIDTLTAEVKAAVIAGAESIKGAHLHAVYAAGRVTWDGKRLDGYAAAHPEVMAFRKVGEPSVSIRGVK